MLLLSLNQGEMKQHPVCLHSCPEHPSMVQWHNTQERLYQSLLRGKETSEIQQLREYLCFSIRQEEVSSTFVFRGTGAVDHELHLNLHFLGIILALDALRMEKNATKRKRAQNNKTELEKRWKDVWVATRHALFTLIKQPGFIGKSSSWPFFFLQKDQS